ncbi:hypothetical protein [Elizabethkingia phage TCUEAP1]|nr:hypothetical protein [Elizabethkingia phage TCUEAP1]
MKVTLYRYREQAEIRCDKSGASYRKKPAQDFQQFYDDTCLLLIKTYGGSVIVRLIDEKKMRLEASYTLQRRWPTSTGVEKMLIEYTLKRRGLPFYFVSYRDEQRIKQGHKPINSEHKGTKKVHKMQQGLTLKDVAAAKENRGKYIVARQFKNTGAILEGRIFTILHSTSTGGVYYRAKTPEGEIFQKLINSKDIIEIKETTDYEY